MPRNRQHAPLRVLLNNRLVGHLSKEPGGVISFRYAESWLALERASPVSLSLPLREDAYKGAPVHAVFENLLPDSEALRRRIAEKVGADGTDSYSMLSRIGRDCVGALQFIPDGDPAASDTTSIEGQPVSDRDIEKLLNNLAQAPLGLDQDKDFRISVAGAQEKTALLRHEGKWWKPHGTTPTTHIFKTQLGTLPNGLDLTHSVENEFYCLKLVAAFGLPVNAVKMRRFGKTKAVVIERFDRRWTQDGRLLRVPQEDCCQALSIPPTRKYQNEGGPGMVDILALLKASDTPAADQKQFLKAQVLYWLMGATDGHAKNFSLFLGPGGRFMLTPIYDVLTAQPSLDARHILKKNMKLAMFAGDSRHYRIDYLQGRHFIQTTERAGLPAALAQEVLDDVASHAAAALTAVEKELPPGFPEEIHASVHRGFQSRLERI
ncbi:MAG: type II toxin-antitoxin system HipA family toxin [Prosthecobacter sp.]|uniref:type II toxin-antitoxin system HipA family toxin n=1 Tax=Prosthecobacter sp. TaxID=1965333 RepID=UPI003BB1B63F